MVFHMVRISTQRDVFSFLRYQARSKNVTVTASFRNEIFIYVRSLRTRKVKKLYPRLREIREPYERLIMSVIGYEAILLAYKRRQPADSNTVMETLDKLKVPEWHEPDDPDDTCRKTAAINIIRNREKFRSSLPSRPDFM